jgi:hypothetical protein
MIPSGTKYFSDKNFIKSKKILILYGDNQPGFKNTSDSFRIHIPYSYEGFS